MPTMGVPGLSPAGRAHAFPLGSRRRLLRVRLRAWRLVRRHYLTFVSGAVFVGVLVTVFTSAGFGVEESPRDTAGTEEADASSNPVLPVSAASATAAGVLAYRPRPRSYPVIYYLVDSEEQQYAMEQAIQSDTARRVRQGPNDPANADRQILLVTTAEEERQTTIFILDIAYAAAAEGVSVMVVDLR